MDAVIVGAGPAGLFAALELSKSKARVVVVDQGGDISERLCPMKMRDHCLHCQPCHIMCGVGGAGTYSDGLLNLHPAIGGDLERLAGSRAWMLVEEVDCVFLRYGALGRRCNRRQMMRRCCAAKQRPPERGSSP